MLYLLFFFFSSRRRHTRCYRDWSSDVCSSDLPVFAAVCTLMKDGSARTTVGSTRERSSRNRMPASHWPSIKEWRDRKSTRLNSSHGSISYAVFCLKKKKSKQMKITTQ